MRRGAFAGRMAALLLGMFFLCAGAARADAVLTAYRDALLGQLDKLEGALPGMTETAEVVAARLLSGGNLYVAGDESFVVESFVRAGGLMLVMRYTEQAALGKADTLLVGMAARGNESAVKTCRRAREAGAYVVLFSPEFVPAGVSEGRLCDAHVANFADAGSPVVAVGGDKRVGPVSALYNVTALWVFTGELVGALTRKGKMPVMWRSVAVPDGRVRNGRYYVRDEPSRRRFHTDMAVPPQARGKLGGAYVDVVRRQVGGLRGPVLEQLSGAAEMMAGSVRAGATVHVQTISHFTTYEVTDASAPGWVKADCEARLRGVMKAEQLAGLMRPGDVFFQLGYHEATSHPYHEDAGYVELLRQAGAKTAIALCHAPVAALGGPQPDVLIDAQWEYGDGAVPVPGYDTKILPSSGVLQTVIFWSVAAKGESILLGGE